MIFLSLFACGFLAADGIIAVVCDRVVLLGSEDRVLFANPLEGGPTGDKLRGKPEDVSGG